LELCVVIGKEARNVAKTDALDYVFGYTVMLDMTARGPNSPGTGVGSCRSVRKGFETFAPIGLKKALTTKDTPRRTQGGRAATKMTESVSGYKGWT
jgi:2-keto-4-pentenoate hydratase/2-oxohepta-3-ene-1,7-dioic acid hydratase in catechol pathway